jgi:hypothetical protein
VQLAVMFPLTLTLSPAERERVSNGWDNSRGGVQFPAWRRVLLLPEGVVRGEGKCGFRIGTCSQEVEYEYTRW